jgi:ABC-2 type transport system ATP-binding protein
VTEERADAHTAAISVDALRVVLGERVVLDGLTFDVAPGELLGLLGPNGAGKTTTLSVLATLIMPSSGSATVGGHRTDREARAVRREIGYVPQMIAIYPTLTARENAVFFGRVAGLGAREARRAAAEALEVVGLEARADDPASTYSGGMQRRLNLACGLLRAPRVLLLDEPTVGVDPQSRERIFAAVRAQADAGVAVLYSTHYMEEAERICDRVVLIDEGRVVTSGAPAALIRAIGDGLHLEVVTAQALPAAWLEGLAGARAHAHEDGDGMPSRGSVVRVSIEKLELAPRVLERAASHGGRVLEFHVEQPSLQDVFISLTGRALRD